MLYQTEAEQLKLLKDEMNKDEPISYVYVNHYANALTDIGSEILYNKGEDNLKLEWGADEQGKVREITLHKEDQFLKKFKTKEWNIDCRFRDNKDNETRYEIMLYHQTSEAETTIRFWVEY